VKRNASKLGVDPNRVGVLGFSAGAITGLQLAIAQEQGDRPSFAALIYGPLAPVNVPAPPPPLFLARALNDNLYTPLQSSSLEDNFGLLSSWQAAGGSVELHLYSGGGHGFGMQNNGETSELWVEQFFKWMEARKLLGHVK
jgi:acetyl esterase/lipase